ncbi:MAG: nicotinate-nucleotide adenylyltransferase [Candidatus Omnitrophica bacterium]|nr:nicotinate-nucleotide adenylyltransferase [Candidatus Omnitrophota bacterium]
MKIGILGGTFNPIHYGHLLMAEQVLQGLGLDRVIFIPSNLPPHKQEDSIASAKDRLVMVKKALKQNPRFFVSDIEIRRKGKSYSVETLRQLKKIYPDDKLFFITGSDLINYLGEWKDVDEIFALADFVVANRPGYILSSLPERIVKVNIKSIDISAYEIRNLIRAGRSARYLVPDEVRGYIEKRGLYR